MAKRPTGEPAAFSTSDDLFSLFSQPAVQTVEPVIQEPLPPTPAKSAMTNAGAVVPPDDHQIIPVDTRYVCVDPSKLLAMLQIQSICAGWNVTYRGPLVVVSGSWEACSRHQTGTAKYLTSIIDTNVLTEDIAARWGWKLDVSKRYQWKLGKITELESPFDLPTSWGFFTYDQKTRTIGP